MQHAAAKVGSGRSRRRAEPAYWALVWRKRGRMALLHHSPRGATMMALAARTTRSAWPTQRGDGIGSVSLGRAGRTICARTRLRRTDTEPWLRGGLGLEHQRPGDASRWHRRQRTRAVAIPEPVEPPRCRREPRARWRGNGFWIRPSSMICPTERRGRREPRVLNTICMHPATEVERSRRCVAEMTMGLRSAR